MMDIMTAAKMPAHTLSLLFGILRIAPYTIRLFLTIERMFYVPAEGSDYRNAIDVSSDE